MKVLHFADTHLGVENYGRPDPETGLHTRLLDFLRNFDEMIDRATEERVELAIFAGDAYRTRNPSPTHQREFAKRIMKLAELCPVLLLAGNHDVYSAKGKASTLDIFRVLAGSMAHLQWPGIIVANRPGVIEILTYKGDVVQIVTLPWVVRSHLLAGADTAGLTDGGVTKAIEDRLRAVVEGLLGQLHPDMPAILAAHGTVPGAVYGSEHTVMLGREIMLPLDLLTDRRIDYVALGHIHKHQVLYEQPAVIYPGSIDRVDFGEEREPKGFVIAHLEGGGAKYEFIELQSTRRFVTIEIDADGDDPIRQINEVIDKNGGAVVRLIIHTTPEANAKLSDAEIHSALEGAHHVASIVRDVKRETRQRIEGGQNVSQMTPTELLGSYLESKDTPQERADALLEHAQALMATVDGGGDG